MKKILIMLSSLMILSSCARDYESVYDCLSPNTEDEKLLMMPQISIKQTVETYWLNQILSTHTSIHPVCSASCAPLTDPNITNEVRTFNVQEYMANFPKTLWINTLASIEDRQVCIPNKKKCEDGSYVDFTGFDLSKAFSNIESPNPNLVYNASAINLATYADCEENVLVCIGDTVKNTETNTCVDETIPCTAENMPANASEGIRTFNTESNTYSACVPTSCSGGFTLVEGMCVENAPEVVICVSPQVRNSETNTCVDETIPCTAGELPASATAGIKTFNTTSNSYGSCVATSCSAGTMLMGGTCMPIIMPPMPVMGCTDPSAANYNPSATMNDMSCFCADENVVWSFTMGCNVP